MILRCVKLIRTRNCSFTSVSLPLKSYIGLHFRSSLHVCLVAEIRKSLLGYVALYAIKPIITLLLSVRRWANDKDWRRCIKVHNFSDSQHCSSTRSGLEAIIHCYSTASLLVSVRLLPWCMRWLRQYNVQHKIGHPLQRQESAACRVELELGPKLWFVCLLTIRRLRNHFIQRQTQTQANHGLKI